MSSRPHSDPGFCVTVHATSAAGSPSPLVAIEFRKAGAPTAGLVLDPEMARTLAGLLVEAAAMAEQPGFLPMSEPIGAVQ